MNEGINITSAMLDLFKKLFDFWKNKESEVSLWFYQELCISHGCCPRPKLRNSAVKYITVYKTTTNIQYFYFFYFYKTTRYKFSEASR